MRTLIYLALAAFVLAFAAPAAAQGPEGEVRMTEYTIQAGDTCTKVAEKLWNDRRRYDLIHKHNPKMGPTPHKLIPGEKLAVPVFETGPEAELTAAHREVRSRAPERHDWADAEHGQDLFKYWRVNTLERSAAEVTFRDTSVIQMRENTLIIIYGASRQKSRRIGTTAELERGALRSRLGEILGGQTLKVTMPSGQAELTGGQALVSVDSEGSTRLANHGSGKAAVAGKAGKKVKVKRGMGSKVKKGKPPSKPKPLPPTPVWKTDGPSRFVGATGLSGSVFGEWQAVDAAERYYVEIARKPDGRDVIAAQTVPKQITRFEAHGLPPGEYFVTLASVDDDEFESIPSSARAIELVAVNLEGPGGSEAQPPPEGAEDGNMVASVLPGTQVTPPAGMKCRVGKGDPSAPLVLERSGPQAISCVDEGGDDVPGFVVGVVEVGVAANAAGESVRLDLGRRHTVPLQLSSPVRLPDTIVADAPEGITVHGIKRTGDAEWELDLEAGRNAPDSGVLLVRLAPDSNVAVAQLAFATESAEVAPAPAPGPDLHAGEIGIAGGIFWPSANHEFFGPENSHEELDRGGPEVALRAGYFPVRWVGIEGEGGVIPARTRSGGRATLWTLRGHLVAQLPYRVTPFVLAGGGGAWMRSRPLGNDGDGFFHFGGGLKIYASKRVALRVDVRDTVAPGLGAGIAHHIDLLAGLSIVLGRRSAGRSDP